MTSVSTPPSFPRLPPFYRNSTHRTLREALTANLSRGRRQPKGMPSAADVEPRRE